MNRLFSITLAIVTILLLAIIVIPGLVSASADNPGDDATVLTTNGFDLYKAARYKDSQVSFDKAIALDPYSSLSWYGKGLASAALNDKEGAIQALDRATELSPKDEQAWLKKGEVYLSMSRNDLAITAYKRAFLINPNNLEAQRNLEALGIRATPTTVDYSQYPSDQATKPTPAKNVAFASRGGMIMVIGMVFIIVCYKWHTIPGIDDCVENN